MSYERKVNTGSLFRNEKRTSEQHPSAKGDMLLACPHCKEENEFWISAWTNTSQKGDKYQSLKADPKEISNVTELRTSSSVELDDEIPF
tara:strand:- start:291 stop:557 length:267 start_codon:yes stop_codon:yes gene_type:complete